MLVTAYNAESGLYHCGYCFDGYETAEDAFDCEVADQLEDGFDEDQAYEWSDGNWAY